MSLSRESVFTEKFVARCFLELNCKFVARAVEMRNYPAITLLTRAGCCMDSAGRAGGGRGRALVSVRSVGFRRMAMGRIFHKG